MSLGDKLRTLFRLLFLFMVLLTVGMVAAVTTIRFTVHGRQEKLPNLVGEPVESATQTLAAAGLRLRVEDKLYSNRIASGDILEQAPPAGSLVRPRQYVHVLLSLGPTQVTIPNVVGSTMRAAQITTVQQGLTIGDVASVFWPQGEPGEVVAQDPPPAAANVRSPAVDFLLSLGNSPPAFLCPNFVGKPLAEARRELSGAGFNNIQLTSVSSLSAPPGTVIQQAPLPGNRVTPDSVFTFEVATHRRDHLSGR